MILSRVILPLLLIFSLIGCVKADRDHNKNLSEELSNYSLSGSLINFNNRALFEAGDIVLEDVKFSNRGASHWKQVNSMQMWFKLCGLKDRASQGTIRNEKFHISSELGEEIVWSREGEKAKTSNPVTVNSGNCLRWAQSVPVFDYLAPSANLVLHFQIKSLSGQLGRIIKRFGFNPWDMYRKNSLSKGYFDLTDFNRNDWHSGRWIVGEDEVIAALKGELESLKSTKPRLQMKSLSIVPDKQEVEKIEEYHKRFNELSDEEKKSHVAGRDEHLRQTDLKMKINMRGFPFVTVDDSTGTPHVEDILTGRFKVYMNLIGTGTNPGSPIRYHLAEGLDDGTVVNSSTQMWDASSNGLIASIPMVLRHDVEYGNVKLAVKIVPLDMQSVAPFEAVFNLGPHDQWMRRQSLTFDTNLSVATDEVDYDTYVKGAKPVDEDLTSARKAELFYMSTLNMRFVRIMPGETATDRTLQYSVKSCIEDGFWGTRVGRGLQFEVITEDEGKPHKMIRQTNNEGCLTWFGFLSHKYYRKEVLFEKTAKLRFIGTVNNQDRFNSMVNTYDKEVTYYMNPWDEKWTFGWDEPDMPENYAEEIKEQRKTAPESKIFVADFKYQTMGFRYAIDKHLNLKVKKAVLLSLYPYVLKYNSIVFGRRGTERLRDGIYLLKVALQKDYLDPAAKGVRIYDCNYKTPVDVAEVDSEPEFLAEQEALMEDYDNLSDELKEKLRLYNIIDLGAEVPSAQVNSKPCSKGEIVHNPNETPVGEGEQIEGGRLLSEEELRRSKKRYISVQQKLVRVQGGMIITPIEFEVDDLRLMRIRNQFFIQLQTIDERKLRVAALLDEALTGKLNQWNLKDQFAGLYDSIGETGQIEDEEFQKVLDDFVQTNDLAKAFKTLKDSGVNIEEAQKKLIDLFNTENIEEGSAEYDALMAQVKEKLLRLLQYKKNGLVSDEAFGNEKRLVINSIVHELEVKSEEHLNEQLDLLKQKEKEQGVSAEMSEDPLLKEFLFGRTALGVEDLLMKIIQRRIDQAEASGDKDRAEILHSLRIADFTQIALTPSFDFDLITNDGEYQPSYDSKGNEIDDGTSGLPSRTFVGPLTFVFNTNGSALRPTDTLGEGSCNTPYCEKPEAVAKHCTSAFCEDAEVTADIMNSEMQTAVKVGKNGALQSDVNKPILKTGESINSSYEKDKYYGYLGSYFGMTVDDLIKEKRRIDVENERKMRVGSQIFNFTKTMKLKFTLLNDRAESRLKEIAYINCAEDKPLSRLEECYQDVTSSNYVLTKSKLLEQVNNRKFRRPEFDPQRGQVFDPGTFDTAEHFYNIYQKEITTDDINRVVREDITEVVKRNSPDAVEELKMRRGFYYKMCFVLTQNFFKDSYFDREATGERKWKNKRANQQTLEEMEMMCHEYVNRMYGLDHIKGLHRAAVINKLDKENGALIPRPNPVNFSPIVFERKARVYGTTGRYVYRGGKSLNINLSTSFNLSSSSGIKVVSTATWKPYDMATTGIAFVVGGAIAATVGMPAGAMAVGAAIVTGVYKTIIGGFGWSRTTGKDESAGTTQGVNVSSGTFLVSQQATLDIELGNYERCMVARFHPVFLRNFFNQTKHLKKGFRHGDDYKLPGIQKDNSDIESYGVMICTGKPEKECLPVTEKYYYFTQHFTEGDMLDTADMHNHPWLLQLRGVRDFKTFTASIGAREVDYIDDPNWGAQTMSRVLSDAASMNLGASDGEAMTKEFQIIDRNSEINWPLTELSRVYFQVLPTFPGLYTFYDNKPDWPYYDTSPGRDFTDYSKVTCEPPAQQ